MASVPDFYILEEGADCPHSYRPDKASAQVRLAELQAEFPAKSWAIVDAELFMKAKEDAYLKNPLIEIDKEQFEKALNLLPPVGWTRSAGVERFHHAEAIMGPILQQYARIGDRFFTKPVRYADEATYITPSLVLNSTHLRFVAAA